MIKKWKEEWIESKEPDAEGFQHDQEKWSKMVIAFQLVKLLCKNGKYAIILRLDRNTPIFLKLGIADVCARIILEYVDQQGRIRLEDTGNSDSGPCMNIILQVFGELAKGRMCRILSCRSWH